MTNRPNIYIDSPTYSHITINGPRHNDKYIIHFVARDSLNFKDFKIELTLNEKLEFGRILRG